MLELNSNVFLINGAYNHAIYDTGNKKIYSINTSAKNIILRYANEKNTIDDNIYLDKLFRLNILSRRFCIRKFYPSQIIFNLEMAWLEVTQKCNLKCIHCYEGQIHKSCANSLSLHEWFNIIEKLVSLNIKRIVIIGGEPSCYPNILEILDFASNFNIKVVYFTNATLLNDSLINLIIRKNIYVKFSIYGHTPEIHDAITQVPGSFIKTTNSLRKLSCAGVDLEASLIIMKENQDVVDNIIDWIRCNNFIYKRYDIIRKTSSMDCSTHNVTNPKILSKFNKSKPNFSISYDDFIKNINYNSCWYGKLAILENGDILPCVFARDYIYDNIRNSSLTSIISEKIIPTCKNLQIDKIKKCKFCEYRYACHDCRPIAIGATADIYGPIQRCGYDPKQGLWRKLLS